MRTRRPGANDRDCATNLATQLGLWPRLKTHFRASEGRTPNIARHLHDSIRLLLKDGKTESLFIASEALKALEESEPGTQQAWEG